LRPRFTICTRAKGVDVPALVVSLHFMDDERIIESVELITQGPCVDWSRQLK